MLGFVRASISKCNDDTQVYLTMWSKNKRSAETDAWIDGCKRLPSLPTSIIHPPLHMFRTLVDNLCAGGRITPLLSAWTKWAIWQSIKSGMLGNMVIGNTEGKNEKHALRCQCHEARRGTQRTFFTLCSPGLLDESGMQLLFQPSRRAEGGSNLSGSNCPFCIYRNYIFEAFRQYISVLSFKFIKILAILFAIV